MEACLVRYIDTFSWPPDGYINNGRLPTFTVIDLTNEDSSSDEEEL